MVKEGERITKSGQKIVRKTLGKTTYLDYKQNPTTDGFSNNYSVCVYDKQFTQGQFVSMGSVSKELIETVSRFLQIIYDLIDGDVERLIKFGKKAIKDESPCYSIEGLKYSEYERLHDILKELRDE